MLIINWIAIEEFENDLNLKLETRRKVLPAILELQELSPNEWLKSERKLNNFNFYYFLYWSIKTNQFSNEDSSKIAMKKIIECKGTKARNTLEILVHFGFFNKDIKDKIGLEYPNLFQFGLRYFLLHFLYINKPFGKITEDEINCFFRDFSDYNIRPYSKQLLKKILYSFGYYDKPATRSKKSLTLETLFKHPKFGLIIQEYNAFIIASDAKKKFRSLTFSVLSEFIKYLDQNNIDTRQLNRLHLEKYIDYCLDVKKLMPSTIVTYMPKIQSFLDWSVGAYEELPNQKIEFPKVKLSILRKEAERHREESDGLAFEREEFPEIIISILKSFEPKNETEFLAYNYWRIISSCPVRRSFALNLEYKNCMYPMLNEKDVLCLYSSDADKGGNKNGQFPIIDEEGINAVKELEERIESNIDNFKPIQNDRSKRSFIHLFQFQNTNTIFDSNAVSNFADIYLKPEIARILNMNVEDVKFSSHSFRHYLLTHIIRKTGNEEAAQAAAGHHDGKMIRKAYIKSKHAKNALLYRVIDKYESGEITGKFYLKLIAKLTETTEFNSEVMNDLETEIELEEYIKKHGRKTAIGYCFEEEQSCNHYLKCWNCSFFMMKREEITGAVQLLTKLIMEFKDIQKHSINFDIHSTIAQNKLRAIAMIKERLSDLKYTDEQIEEMILKQF